MILLWTFAGLAVLSLLVMVWGYHAGKAIESFSPPDDPDEGKVKVTKGSKTVDTDLSDGKIGAEWSNLTTYEYSARLDITYSAPTLIKAWKANNPTLKRPIMAIVAGEMGVILFSSLALLAYGQSTPAIFFALSGVMLIWRYIEAWVKADT